MASVFGRRGGLQNWSIADAPNGVMPSLDERRLLVSISDEKAPQIMVYDLDGNRMPRESPV